MEALRAELAAVAADALIEPVERALLVTGLLTEALAGSGTVPVLVGGMAVQFWTGSQEFATLDIDLVLDDSRGVDDLLVALGFAQAANRRHWEIPGTDVIVEFPSRDLEPAGAKVEHVSLSDGRTARVVSQVDLVLGRVLELTLTPHEEVTLQVLALLAEIDQPALLARAHEVEFSPQVMALLMRLLPVARAIATGARAVPGSEDLYDLVRGS